jgi:ADP-ribose pyrophosphatase YjhB (NUDIX family)
MRPVVRAFIFNPEGSILLARHEKDSPWVLPGGHIEANEALHDAMMREIREEFGLKARFFDSDESETYPFILYFCTRDYN